MNLVWDLPNRARSYRRRGERNEQFYPVIVEHDGSARRWNDKRKPEKAVLCSHIEAFPDVMAAIRASNELLAYYNEHNS